MKLRMYLENCKLDNTHTMKKLTWRLSKLPTPDEVRELVKDKIITQDEAREILFKEDTEKEIKAEELKSEIEFLRKLVDKLSNGNYNTVTTYIHEYPKKEWNWYPCYQTWSTPNTNLICSTATNDAIYTGQSNLVGSTGSISAISAISAINGTTNSSFSSIQTF